LNRHVPHSPSTRLIIFPIQHIVSTLSKPITLQPPHIIPTPTPSQVSKGFQPPKFLTSPDQLQLTIQPIPTLSNPLK
ncbi:fumarylacetoacetate hydrolase family protein, partial [Bacillus altitudinis]|uniref:fumarylacetoacetate hydrolase family protein n=1 Tax=Bacillus altitudinis TaxID=293387 RepID=UPI0016437930